MATYKFKVHGGSFGKGKGTFKDGLIFKTLYIPGKFLGHYRSARDVVSVVPAAQETKGASPVAAGALGWMVFGPLGALLGAAASNQTNEVTFVVTFKDGKSFVASADLPTFQRLLALR